MQKQVCLYCRTSTDRQSKGLESQERALIEYCKQKGITDYVVFKDEGVSGTKQSRPALNEMMSLVENGQVKMVLVYSFSRFARSTRHLVEALDLFQCMGVEFVSVSEQIDTSTSIGKAVYTIISAISALERDLISERVVAGLDNAKAKGKELGRPITRRSKLIQALYEKGYSYREIAELAGCSPSTAHREIMGSKNKKS